MIYPKFLLDDLITTKGGGTPSKKIKEYWDGDIPWASVKDLTSTCLSKTQDYITKAGLENSNSNLIPEDNIILATRMAVGRVCINNFPVAINQDLRALFCSDKILSRYLLWFLLSSTHILENQASGATVKGITLDAIKNLEVPLPPLEEQKRIAAILDKVDRVRRKRQEVIRLTEELGRSIFLDMFGDPVTNPKGWEKVALSKIVKGDIRNGLSPSTKGSYHGNVLTLAAVTQGFFKSSEYKSGMFDVEPPENKKVHASDFMVCRGNGNINLVGRACFSDQDYQDILFPDTIIGVPVNLLTINQKFLQTMWNSPLVRRQIEQQACTTNGTYKINQTTLKNIEILLPPFSLQSKFGEAFESINSIKTKFSSLIVENLFNSLLQRAFRGEL